MMGRDGQAVSASAALLAALALVAGAVSCFDAKSASAPPPRVIVITPSEARASPEYLGAEAFVRARAPKGAKADVSHVVLPDLAMSGDKAGGLAGSSEVRVAAFIAAAAADPRVKAVVVDPAVPGSAEGFRRAKAGRSDLFCVAGDSREDCLTIEAAADLVVDIDRVFRAWLIPWAAKKMGAKALVAVYSQGEGSDPRALRERAIMAAACADLGLRYAAMAPPAGTEAAAYARAMTGAWLRDFGSDTALYCSDGEFTAPLLSGAISGGGMIVDAAGRATRGAYAAAIGLDLGPAKGDARKERALVEAAVCALGGRGRFGMWDADFEGAGVAGLAEFALRVVTGAARRDELKDLLSALDARSHPAAWLAAYDVDPDTGVKSGNHVLARQDIYVLGSGYLQSALQAVPAKFLTIGGSGG